jgi:hypothetical protein
MAVPRGLEPPTFGLGNSRSRLNFERRCVRRATVFVAHVDISLTGFDIVEPLSVNQQRTGKQAEHQMQDGSTQLIFGIGRRCRGAAYPMSPKKP